MKGRTNIDGNGISINATVEPKTIKSGNIIAGDFVEYYSLPAYIEQTQEIDFVFSLNGYDIAKVGGMLTAFKDGEQKFTYTTHNCVHVQKYSNRDGDLIIFCDPTSSTIGVLTISYSGFLLLDSVQMSKTVSTYNHNVGICAGGQAGDGKIVVFSSGSSAGKSDFFVVGITNEGALHDYKETIGLTGFGTGEHLANKFVCYYGGIFYALAESENTSQYHQVYSNDHIYVLNIDSSNNVTKDSSYTLHFAGSDELREVYRKNDVVIFAYYKYLSPSSNDKTQILNVVNFTTGNYNEKQLLENGAILTYINNSIFIANSEIKTHLPSDVYPNGYPINNGLKLYRLNEETYEVTLLDFITLDVDYEQYVEGENYYDVFTNPSSISGNNLGICNANLAYIQCKGHLKYTTITLGVSGNFNVLSDDKNIYLFDISQNVIQDIPQKNYVVPYYYGKRPIGVAKDSGNTNDVIDVYVPSV